MARRTTQRTTRRTARRCVLRTAPSLAVTVFGVTMACATSGCSTSPSTGEAQPLYIKHYVDEHYRDVGDRFLRPMTRAEFAERLLRTRVLYLGDHHRDLQLHQQILELVDWLCDRGLRPVIGMEALGSQDNPGLQEFMSGGIGFDELRARVAARWSLSWLERDGVDREFFRELLHRARGHRLDAFPLEPTPRLPLAERDAVIAKTVRRVLRLYPDRLVVVIVGHAHLMGVGHLRGRVGADSMAITARCPETLAGGLVAQLPVRPDSFLRTDRDVLFFPAVIANRASD